jgi:ribose transport system ATP-binding protein
MLGHPIASHEEQPQRPSTIAGQEPMFRVEGLAGGTLAGLDLEVWPGEVVGVCGLTGSGREAVAGLMFGASPRRGRVWVSGTEVVRSSPRDSKHAGLALVPAERRRSALLSDADVRENLVLAGLRTISRLRVLSRRKERLEVHSWIGRMAIKTPSGRFPIINLSGGNQQKVILARWLRLHPRVLILDEPTQGVDIGAKQEIYNHLRAIAAAGTSVIICSTDSEEIVEACDRALVLSQGRLHAELAGPALTLNHLNHTIAAA